MTEKDAFLPPQALLFTFFVFLYYCLSEDYKRKLFFPIIAQSPSFLKFSGKPAFSAMPEVFYQASKYS